MNYLEEEFDKTDKYSIEQHGQKMVEKTFREIIEEDRLKNFFFEKIGFNEADYEQNLHRHDGGSERCGRFIKPIENGIKPI